MFRYPVRLAPDDDDTVVATFPDVPEAVTFGDDEDDALMHAVDALLTAFAHRIDEHREIPAPSRPGRGEPSVDLPPLAAGKVALSPTMGEQRVSKAGLARRVGIPPARPLPGLALGGGDSRPRRSRQTLGHRGARRGLIGGRACDPISRIEPILGISGRACH